MTARNWSTGRTTGFLTARSATSTGAISSRLLSLLSPKDSSSPTSDSESTLPSVEQPADTSLLPTQRLGTSPPSHSAAPYLSSPPLPVSSQECAGDDPEPCRQHVFRQRCSAALTLAACPAARKLTSLHILVFLAHLANEAQMAQASASAESPPSSYGQSTHSNLLAFYPWNRSCDRSIGISRWMRGQKAFSGRRSRAFQEPHPRGLGLEFGLGSGPRVK